MPDADCGNKPAFYHRQLEHESDPTGMLNKKLALQVFPAAPPDESNIKKCQIIN
jgi:hypothetical protein